MNQKNNIIYILEIYYVIVPCNIQHMGRQLRISRQRLVTCLSGWCEGVRNDLYVCHGMSSVHVWL